MLTGTPLQNHVTDFLIWHHLPNMAGTPLQNHVTELWAILNFLEPRKFDDLDGFLLSYGALPNMAHAPPP